MCRAFKEAGMKRKRLKIKPMSLLHPNIIQKSIEYVLKVLWHLNRRLLFLDDSGFNLHTSTKYGFAPVNVDPVLYRPSSKGQNISLSAILSPEGLRHFELYDGAVNSSKFKDFLQSAFNDGLFQGNSVLIMDNIVKNYLQSINVEVLFYFIAI